VASVRFEHVKKVYDGGIIAVHDFTMEIQEREFIVMVGPSGCGKSTTLRMLAGLEEVTEGKIFIDDHAVNNVPPKDRDIAMVFQNYALYPHMTVFENMAFGLKLRKFPKQEISQRVNEAASILGLEEYLTRKPKALSGGQRQRVALGRAIVRKPRVFLFDEPLSNLDAKLRVQMRTEISKLHQRIGATMIYVTHDQIEAMTMADRIVLLKDGHVQQIDTAMNFFEGRIEKGKSLCFVLEGTKNRFVIQKNDTKRLAVYSDREVIMGLRPEHIDVVSGSALKNAKNLLVANVEVLEPMGNELFLYFTAKPSGKRYVARTNSEVRAQVASSVSLTFDMSNAHYFDKSNHLII
jgi:multiple sugar transport system ATP-binding protein